MIVKINSTDKYYSIAKDWWEGHQFPILPRTMLPKKVMVRYNDNNEETHMIFIYHTDSELCWIGFPVSNPLLDRESKKGGLLNLIKGTIEYCKQSGFSHIFTTSPIIPIQEKLKESGFILGDNQVNHYIKNL